MDLRTVRRNKRASSYSPNCMRRKCKYLVVFLTKDQKCPEFARKEFADPSFNDVDVTYFRGVGVWGGIQYELGKILGYLEVQHPKFQKVIVYYKPIYDNAVQRNSLLKPLQKRIQDALEEIINKCAEYQINATCPKIYIGQV